MDGMLRDLERLTFKSPVACVYNPLIYARESYDTYWRRYAGAPRKLSFWG